ncbi:hypothetical protein FH972_015250 [Carpinus fangiana]|uniref:Uncharacterized protein n=1 Tax=Carpinus fangiana TaxID=176857 RepID=A0A5N6RC84_9ROSI|nr:hypothetical protein FH972_015250 [Carpinus fangiana]
MLGSLDLDDSPESEVKLVQKVEDGKVSGGRAVGRGDVGETVLLHVGTFGIGESTWE